MKDLPIHGIQVAAITPRRSDGAAVNLSAALELIDFLCTRGVNGITLLGSTGEFLHFDLEDRARLVTMGVKRSRVPVLANVSHSTLEGTLRLTEEAFDAGAAGMLIMPPYFFKYGPEVVREYFLRLAALAPRGARLFLYNIPFFTSEIPAEVAAELVRSGVYLGIKDSSGNFEYFSSLAAVRKEVEFALISGSEPIYRESRAAGADAIVSGCASAVPELMVALERALAADDSAMADQLNSHLREFFAWFWDFPMPVMIREAAALRGIATGPHASPLGPTGTARLEEFRAWFRNWWPAVEKLCQS